MQQQRYSQLNPLAIALAAGCAALVGLFLIVVPMFGMMGGGGYGGMSRGDMGPYASGHMWGAGTGPLFSLIWAVGSAICVAIVGAIFAWIYNALIARGAVSSSEQSPS